MPKNDLESDKTNPSARSKTERIELESWSVLKKGKNSIRTNRQAPSNEGAGSQPEYNGTLLIVGITLLIAAIHIIALIHYLKRTRPVQQAN